MNTCRCGKPIPDAGWLCWPCTNDLKRDLARLAEHVPLLPGAIAHGITTGMRYGTIGGSGHSDGLRIPALDTDVAITSVVTGWLRVLIESRRIPMPTHRTSLREQVAILQENIPAIRRHEAAWDIRDEISSCVRGWPEWRDSRQPEPEDDEPDERTVVTPHQQGIVSTVDAKRAQALPDDLSEQAAAIGEEWWAIPRFYEREPGYTRTYLERMLPEGVRAPSRRTVERWAYGRKERGRVASVPCLRTDGDTIRVGALLDLLTHLAQRHADVA